MSKNKFGSRKDLQKSKGLLMWIIILGYLLLVFAIIVGIHFAAMDKEHTTNVLTIGDFTLRSNHVGVVIVVTAVFLGMKFFKYLLSIILRIIQN